MPQTPPLPPASASVRFRLTPPPPLAADVFYGWPLNLIIPNNIDYTKMSGLSNEVKSKFKLIRPKTLGQALRIDGITPAAAYILFSHVKKGFKKRISI